MGMCSVSLGLEDVGLKSWPHSWLWGRTKGRAEMSGWHLMPPGGFGLIFQLKFHLLWACPPALFSSLILVFSRLVPVVLQGLLSCCVCVYINVFSLVVWTNKKLWSSARSQIMSQLVPGTRASREFPRQGGVTGLSFDSEHNWYCKAKGGGWIYRTSIWLAKQNLHIFPGMSGRKVPLLCLLQSAKFQCRYQMN